MDELKPLLITQPRRRSSLFSHKERSGLDVVTASCYVLSLMGVMPIIALPAAVAYSGYAGVGVAVVLLLLICYTAVQLGETWLLAETFYPNIIGPGSNRQPYPLLGEVVGGPRLRKLLTLLQDFTLMGAAMPFLLLASESVQEVVAAVTRGSLDYSFCYWLLLLTLLLLPIMWLGTPADLKMVARAGAALVVVVSGAVVTAMVMDNSVPAGGERSGTFRWPPRWQTLAYCFGAIAFQFDIHPVLLSVQTDMTQRGRMRTAVATAFCCEKLALPSLFKITAPYVPVVVVSWIRYGDSVSQNLLNSLPTTPLLHGVMTAVIFQVLICLCLGINALFQDVEEWLGITDAFGWRRAVCRTCLMLVLLFLCESLPHFGVAIELVGGLLVTPFMFIMPPVFNLILKHRCLGSTSVVDLVVATATILVGLVGCVASTWESLLQLHLHQLVPLPCYIDIIAATKMETEDRQSQAN
ncbi:amino acid transporter AVT1C [Hyalella azteca]|uniref:Amino acid transporter AVT1C n=1 Tax=Hyalella azteca TaxID=294128 RepID=A0A8B7P171_HYAAZ|nr:amino acid transporter AVT1C [Hyalella azteca]